MKEIMSKENKKQKNLNKTAQVFLASTILVSGVATNTDIQSVSAEESNIVTFKDPNLESALRTALKLTSDVQITKDHMLTLKTLDISNKNIQYLNGLEEAKNVTTLKMSHNKIENLDVLSSMYNLQVVVAVNNHITDMKGITNLDKLTGVNLAYNLLTELYPLRKNNILQVTTNLLAKSYPDIVHIGGRYPYVNSGNFVDVLGKGEEELSTISTETVTVGSNESKTVKNPITIKYNVHETGSFATMNVGGAYQLPTGVDRFENFVEKIKWLNQISITPLYGSVTNIQFRDNAVFYEYTAPKNITGSTFEDTITVQLFEGYSVQQKVSVSTQTESVKPTVKYNDNVEIEGIVSPNSTINVYNAVGTLITSGISDSEGYINIPMKQFSPHNKLFLVKQVEEGFKESEATQVIYKDTNKPNLRVNVPDKFSNNSITLTVDASDDVGIAKLEYFFGEVEENNATNGNIIRNNNFQVKKNGTYTVRAVDVNGNATIQKVVINHISNEYPDTPNITVSNTETTKEPVTITVTPKGKEETIMYSVNGGAWLTYYTPLRVTENANFQFKSINKFGNESDIVSTRVSNVISNVLSKPNVEFDDLGRLMTIQGLPSLDYEILNLNTNQIIAKGNLGVTGVTEHVFTPTLVDGDAFTVTLKDPTDNRTSSRVVTFRDIVPPNDIEDLFISKDGNTIQGKSDVDSTVRIVIDGLLVSEVKPDQKGKFTVNIPEYPNGTPVQVYAVDNSGNKSNTEHLVINSYDPTVQEGNSGSLNGQANPNHYVLVEDDKNNIIVAPKKVSEDGTYEISLPNTLQDGQVLYVVVRDENGKVVSKEKLIYKKPVETSINKAGQIITGYKQNPENTINVQNSNNEDLEFDIVEEADGYYEITLKTPIQKGEIIYVIETDKNGNEVNRIELGIITQAPTINVDGTVVTGIGDKDSTVYIYGEDGTLVGIVYVTENGQYITNLSRPAYDGESITVKEIDGKGNVISNDIIQYTDTRSYTNTQPIVKYTGLSLSGNTKPFGQVKVVDKDNNVVGTGEANGSGFYNIDLTRKLNDNEIVQIYLTDKADGETLGIFTALYEGFINPNGETGSGSGVGSTFELELLLSKLIDTVNKQGENITDAENTSTTAIINQLKELNNSTGKVDNTELINQLKIMEKSITDTLVNVDNSEIVNELKAIKDIIADLTDENIILQIQSLENLLKSGEITSSNDELVNKLTELTTTINNSSNTSNIELINEIKYLQDLISTGFNVNNDSIVSQLEKLEEALKGLTDKNIVAQIQSLENLLKSGEITSSNDELISEIQKLVLILDGGLNTTTDNSDIINAIKALESAITTNNLNIDNKDILNKLSDILEALGNLDTNITTLVTLPSDKENGYTLEELKDVINAVVNGGELSVEIIKYLEQSKEIVADDGMLSDVDQILQDWNDTVTDEIRKLLAEIKDGTLLTNDLIKDLMSKLDYINDEDVKNELENIINEWNQNQTTIIEAEINKLIEAIENGREIDEALIKELIEKLEFVTNEALKEQVQTIINNWNEEQTTIIEAEINKILEEIENGREINQELIDLLISKLDSIKDEELKVIVETIINEWKESQLSETDKEVIKLIEEINKGTELTQELIDQLISKLDSITSDSLKEQVINIINEWNESKLTEVDKEIIKLLEEIKNGKEINQELIDLLLSKLADITDLEVKVTVENIINDWYVSQIEKLEEELKLILEELLNGKELTADIVADLEDKLEKITDTELKLAIEEIINEWKESQNAVADDKESDKEIPVIKAPQDKDAGYTEDEIREVVNAIENGAEVTEEVIKDLENSLDNISDSDLLTKVENIISDWKEANGIEDIPQLTDTPSINSDILIPNSDYINASENVEKADDENLPQTGTESNTGMKTAGLMAMIAGLMAFVVNRRKKDNKDSN